MCGLCADCVLVLYGTYMGCELVVYGCVNGLYMGYVRVSLSLTQ